MERVGIRQFRDRLSWYLNGVRQGKALLLTERGEPVAQVTPVTSPDGAALWALVAEGLVEWQGGKPRGAVRPCPSHGGSVADLVLESRR